MSKIISAIAFATLLSLPASAAVPSSATDVTATAVESALSIGHGLTGDFSRVSSSGLTSVVEATSAGGAGIDDDKRQFSGSVDPRGWVYATGPAVVIARAMEKGKSSAVN